MEVYAGDLVRNGAISDLLKGVKSLERTINTLKRYNCEVDGELLMKIVNGEINEYKDLYDYLVEK